MNQAQRSSIMSNIRHRNTKPELKLKKLIRGTGFNYQPKIFGKPDFANFKKKAAIFVDGCFWHQCPRHSRIPKNNQAYWIPKLMRNQIRAEEVNRAYINSDWKIIRIWEHELKNLKQIKKKIAVDSNFF